MTRVPSATCVAIAATVALSLCAASAQAATSQPFSTTSGTIALNLSALSSAGYSVSAYGGDSYNSSTGVLTLGISSVSLASSPGAIDIQFSSGEGVSFSQLLGNTVTLSNLSFNVGSDTLSGNLSVYTFLGIFPLVNLTNSTLFNAGNVSSSFGSQVGTAVTSSTTARAIGLSASNFTLNAGLGTSLAALLTNPTSYNFLGNSLSSIKVGTVAAVPEASSSLLMVMGLGGLMALRARRHKR